MASYGLNPNGLLDSGAELTGVTNSMQNAIDELNAVVEIYKANSSGETKLEFERLQARWNGAIAKMHLALGDGVNRLNEINDNYRMGDLRGAALFGGNV